MITLGLEVGSVLTNAELVAYFRCSPYGGIRVSKAAEAVVLVADFRSAIYLDRWRGNVLEFVGSGRRGDQSLHQYRNRALLEAGHLGRDIFLFEKFSVNQNVYRGVVSLVGKPKESTQNDLDGRARRVYIFQLRPLHKKIDEEIFRPLSELTVEIKDRPDDVKALLTERKQQLGISHLKEKRDATVETALWREYAAGYVEEFLEIFEQLAAEKGLDVAVAYYDLERGSIKVSLTVLAAVASIAGGTMTAIARYPDAKDAWPVLVKDVRHVAEQASVEMNRRLNLAHMQLTSSRPLSAPTNPPIGPSNSGVSRRDDEG